MLTQKVTCQICNKEFKTITPPHLKLHNITMAAYALESMLWSHLDYRARAILVGELEKQGFGLKKPADPIRDLTRAGALILAELERRLRAEAIMEGK